MKYLLAGLAIIAAVGALFFRPPRADVMSAVPRWQPGATSKDPGRSAAPEFSDGSRAAFLAATTAADPGADGTLRAADRHTTRGNRKARHASAEVVVYVAGEVLKPGVYALAVGSRAADALARAGGAKPDADLVAVNLAALLDDGAEVAVPKIGESASSRRASGPRPRAQHSARGHRRGRRAVEPTPEPQSVDLNTADASELETLPGIGPAMAERIVAYRESNGPFTSVDELADISGITPRLQAEITDFLVVR